MQQTRGLETCLAIAAGFCLVITAFAADVNRFGVCAHLARGDEYGELVEELVLMRDAGIGWARADFTWAAIEPSDGVFRFDRYDDVVSRSEAHGVKLLPILCYDSRWAGRAHENLDAWLRFVRKSVERYGDRLRHWEVWNEPNIHFWKPKPDAAQYTELLKRTYGTIKAVDPHIEVMFGGTAGIPLKYIGECLEGGAAGHFDIMAVHPYSYPTAPHVSKRLGELDQLWSLLRERQSATRMWTTEAGWPTHVDGDADKRYDLFCRVLRRLAALEGLVDSKPGIAVLNDPAYSFGRSSALALVDSLARLEWVGDLRGVTLEDVASLDPGSHPLFVGLLGEHFPEAVFPAMKRYVDRGGILCHAGGVPLYYATRPGAGGQWEVVKGAGTERYRRDLGIRWTAFWKDKTLPRRATDLCHVAPGPAWTPPPAKVESTRWLLPSKPMGEPEVFLKGYEGERFVPLLRARDGKRDVGIASAFLDRASPAGGVFVHTPTLRPGRGVTEDVQGAMLARAYITYLARGAEVFFWYEFRDGGRKREYNEHNFGMLRNDMQPKSAYHALKALIEILGPSPEFEGPTVVADDGLVTVVAKGRDGRRVEALWRLDASREVPVPDGCKVRDHLGRRLGPVTRAGARVQVVGQAPIYFVGEP